MIKIQDSFLTDGLFAALKQYVSETPFQIVEVREKSFSVIPTPDWILPSLSIDGHELILTFIRSADKDFDVDLRAHCDGIINGKQTSLASVLYLNDKFEVEPNHGTCFYKHHIHGEEFNGDAAEFDRLLIEDANDYDKWEVVEKVFAEPNRMLVYSSNLFHGKFPNRIISGRRVVMVTFYSEL